MTNDIANRKSGTQISTEMAASLAAGIADSRSTTIIAGGGKPILRMLKTGKWVFGQANDPVQDGSEWAVNPLQILHGWVCWSDYPGAQKNEKLGEVLAPITERKPAKPEPVQGYPYNEVRVFDLRCVYGDDEGVEVVYNASSIGGMRAADALLASIIQQIKLDPAHLVAVVQLGTDSYQHTKYGETFTPLIEIVDWTDMEGNSAGDMQATPEQEQEQEEAPLTTPAPKAAKPRAARAQATEAPAATVSAAAAQERASAPPRRQRPAGRV